MFDFISLNFGIFPHTNSQRWLKLPENTINLCEENDICVSVKKLHIANASFNLYQWIYKEHLDIVRIWRDMQPAWCKTYHNYDKVYLTKTQSPQDNVTTEGEEILETMLTVKSPQTNNSKSRIVLLIWSVKNGVQI